MIKKCKVCDNNFEAYGNRKACSNICQHQLQLNKNRNYYKNNRVLCLQKEKQYRENNKEILKKYIKLYYNINKEKLLDNAKEKYLLNKDKVKIYQKKNRENIRKKQNTRYRNDKNFYIKVNLRNSLSQRIRNNNCKKLDNYVNLIGCSINFLKQYLENQFKDGMTWENHNRYGWHIDHIVGVCNFDLTKLEEQKKCFHYTNLQPLWCDDNLSKKKYMEKEIIQEIEICR